MALYEVPFTSTNGRDEIQAWIYTPATTRPRGVVQLIHGLGEHSRRYLHLIATLVEHGYVVAADDHAGHGATAMRSGIWQDTGERGDEVVVEDEQRLREIVTERFPDLPYLLFGHSWGSMIARALSAAHPEGLAGAVYCGPVAHMRGLEDPALERALEAAIAERGGEALDTDGLSALMFVGANDRYGEGVPPTAWVALDEGVVADHAVDPFNNFGAPMTLRFAKSFGDLYRRCNGPAWAASVPEGLPVLIIAGDQDPAGNFGEGAYALANDLWAAGLRDVRTRVWTGVRHEVHNEPTTRTEVEVEVLAFAERVTAQA
ncbi:MULTISPECIES: alpha/beta hydrolase [unclassified Actinomyces]|uniref:alpha/beta fold hydrolase n=1 Tax=unclassified Actinomyces TaxID=2609248 RepID=UPI0020172802|nr:MULTISPECIES: alpha/beta hydrolase [unclassified Actinomyces]MCL3778224.1 alpha/beta fold hydrolase [Actinomyces sp. AC-20-1]MCL3789127.1 alpha/beta fold hydrolase [Actinomyces sp. 187325]MCL3791482.1 alpha/beta fold hydrolase [Actinomyces sp. 186855]MCL3794072.1 alpha/beta fold hydrolase [Actinomyces sp. 217892]